MYCLTGYRIVSGQFGINRANINKEGSMKNLILLIVMVAFVVGCASNPDKMKTAYVSESYYKDYTCDEINRELTKVSGKCDTLHRQLAKDHSNDQWQMWGGMLIFWPTLLFLEGGDGPEADEYCRLKGEVETLTNLAREKGCLK